MTHPNHHRYYRDGRYDGFDAGDGLEPFQGSRPGLEPIPDFELGWRGSQGRRVEESAGTHLTHQHTEYQITYRRVEQRIVRRPLTPSEPELPHHRPTRHRQPVVPWASMLIALTGLIAVTALLSVVEVNPGLQVLTTASTAILGMLLVVAELVSRSGLGDDR